MCRRPGSFCPAFGREKRLSRGEWTGEAVLSCAPWGQGRETMKDYLPNVPGDEGRGSLHPQPVCPWAERPFSGKGASHSRAASALGSRIKFSSQGCCALLPSKLILVQREREMNGGLQFLHALAWAFSRNESHYPTPIQRIINRWYNFRAFSAPHGY